MLSKLPAKLRKYLPTIVLLVLVVIFGATTWFGDALHKSIMETLKGYGILLLPIVGDLLVGALFLSVAKLFYEPIANGVQRALDRSGASNRGKTLVKRTVQLLYWGIAIFLAASMVAPEVLAKLFLGVSLFGAALALALQGVMKEFISGVLLQLMPKFEVGEYIEVVGLAGAKGKVLDIQYTTTILEPFEKDCDLIMVPNSKFMDAAVKKIPAPKPPEPPPSKLILPSGFKRD